MNVSVTPSFLYVLTEDKPCFHCHDVACCRHMCSWCQADQLVTSRLMRLANHGAVLFTLKALADKAGVAISLENMQLEGRHPESLTGQLK